MRWFRKKSQPRSMAVLTSDGRSLSDEEIAAMFRLPERTAIAASAERARWVAEALVSGPFATVRGEIPAVFDAYARILHPALRDGKTRVRWSEVAAETGATVHRLMQFERVAKIPDDDNAQPAWGVRPYAQGVCDIAAPLIGVLERNTTTRDRCMFGIWEGYGGLDMIPWLASAPKMSKPHRAYFLFEGPIEAMTGFCESTFEPPSVWWPEDRAWFVATDIDINSTYVGGTRACVDAILSDPTLEAFPAEPNDPIHVGADEINPPIV